MIRQSFFPSLRFSFCQAVTSVLQDRRGAIAIVMAITLPVVVGAAGLGIEAGKWYMLKRETQTAADTGAFAGALELAAGTTSKAKPAALQEAARNGFPEGGKVTVVVNIPPLSGTHAGNTKAVEVIVTQTEPLLLAKLFLSEPTSIVARAVGLVTITGNACILALNTSSPKALWIAGNATITMDSCSMASNSTNAESIVFQGNSGTVIPSVWSAGGISSNGGATFPDSTHTYAWPVVDPYAGLSDPVLPGACVVSNPNYQGDNTDLKNTTTTLQPGMYCHGLTIGAKADITLMPGTYYINEGDFTVDAPNANVTCKCEGIDPTAPAGSGVTIVLTSATGTAAGNVKITGGTVNLRAPSVAVATAQYPYPGVLFYKDRRTITPSDSKLTGGATMNLAGAMYFPHDSVEYLGNTNANSCTLLVADKIKVSGTSKLVSSGCKDLGLEPITAKYPSLVE
jgi:hypothetical protein